MFFIFTSMFSAYGQHGKFVYTPTSGQTMLSRTDGSTWLALGKHPVSVNVGDVLKLKGAGKGSLMFPDGTITHLKSKANAIIMRNGLRLRIGYVWAKVRRRADIFKITTPLGSCNVLGTSLDVKINRFGHTVVRVFSGIVAVRAHEDSKNRQLVLQKGMKTTLMNKTKIANKPEKFQDVPIATKLKAEWEVRKFNKQQKIVFGKDLPPILPELDEQPTILTKPFFNTKTKYKKKPLKKEKIQILVRQRSDFQEMLRKQSLKKGSVIGGRFKEKKKMIKRGHGTELGQYYKTEKIIRNDTDLRTEHFQYRNRLLRTQSQIRQSNMEREDLIKRNSTSATVLRQIERLQRDLVRLKQEHRQLLLIIRNIQVRKR